MSLIGRLQVWVGIDFRGKFNTTIEDFKQRECDRAFVSERQIPAKSCEFSVYQFAALDEVADLFKPSQLCLPEE